jgi:hypothetical protein
MMDHGLPPLGVLMAWYQSQCDGEWEHQHGVRIGTLDNPGWSVDVDLAETSQAGKSLSARTIRRSADDWVFLEIKDDVFRARGGPGNLLDLLDLFAAFVEDRLSL